jgi:hypothetical protein
MNLSAKRTVIWTTPPASADEAVEDYRFTMGSCTTVDMGRYWSAMRAFEAWYEKENGQSYEAARSSSDAELSSQALTTWLRAHNHAAIMASLQGMERRTRSTDESSASLATEWEPAEMPATWQSQQDFEANAPYALIGALTETANAVNPGLWRALDDDEAKKKGGVSANW